MKYALLSLLCICCGLTHAAPSADDILESSRNRDDGFSYSTNVQLKLIDSNGRARDRHFHMLQKDLDGEERAIMYFESPADVRGVSFLIANYTEASTKPDDQWMFLPAFRKTRRIGSNDKRGSFMGSTFNYSDLDKVRVSDYVNTLVGEETINGRDTWVIERTPIDQTVINKTGYHQVKVWLDKEREINMLQHYYNAKGIVFKTQETVEAEQIQNIWTIMKSVVKNLENEKVSEMIFSDVFYNVDIKEKDVSQRALKRPVKPHTTIVAAN